MNSIDELSQLAVIVFVGVTFANWLMGRIFNHRSAQSTQYQTKRIASHPFNK